MLRSITDYVMNLSVFLILFTICGVAPGDDCPVLVNEITVMANFDASRVRNCISELNSATLMTKSIVYMYIGL